MFIELVDHLRCVRLHEDGWLVAAAHRTDERSRHIVDGVLGCPICRAAYPVREGVAEFGAPGQAADDGDAAPEPADAEAALRLAALLSLVEVRGPVVLAGAWSALAPALADLAPAAYLLVNAEPAGARRPELSALRAQGALPLAAGAAHAIALDADAARDAGLVAGAARALRGGGRLVAPHALPLPAGVRELARDDRHWVAEREDVGAPVALRRAPGAGG